MRIRSRFAKVLTVATAAVALAACGSSNSPTSPSASGGGAAPTTSTSSGAAGGDTSAKPVTLTWFMWSGSNQEVDAWTHVASMVTAKYPNIKIQFQTTAFNTFWPKLTTQAASGSAPCIIGLQGQRAPQFGNLLVPLDDYMKQAGIKASDFGPSIFQALQSDGHQVALPYDYGPFLIYYNKEAFKAAGLKAPGIGWTTAEFLADAKALTKAPKYGFWVQPDPGNLLPFVLSESGQGALDSSGKLALNTPAWQAGVQFYTDLVTKQRVAAQVPSANSTAASANQFLAGNAFMSLDGPWDLINARALTKFGVGIAPLPAGASGSKTWSDGSGFGVTKDCKNPAEAMKAVGVMTGVDAETYLGNAGRAFPARLAQQTAWYTGNNTLDVKPVMNAVLANATPYKTTPSWQQVVTAYSKQAVVVYNGQGSASDLLSTSQQQGGS